MANREQDLRQQTNPVLNNVQRSPDSIAVPPGFRAGRPPGQMASSGSAPTPTLGRQARDLSTVELVKEITAEVGLLAQKQIELAKAELKADLRAEAATVGGLGVAALAALATVNLLLVTLVLALAQTMRPWLAGLLVSALTLVVAGIVALISWNKRVRSPLERTRRTVKEDVQFTKERMV
ncbi:MAG: phage holin family protein [Myxococcales bacterium]